MNRVWIFQANPKLYDVDAALLSLREIWWRVPQHTTEITRSDVVVIWRSGGDAGVVGVGRVQSAPQLHGIDASESQFVLSPEAVPSDATRVLVAVRPTPFVPKDRVVALPGFGAHQIVRAPMGTVFPVTETEWDALRPLVEAPPEPSNQHREDLPLPFAWGQRAKGVLPMPGGYDGYLESLSIVCEVVEQERPSPAELAQRLEAAFGVKATAARLRESFLRKIGVVVLQAGVCRLGPWAERWRETGDARLIAALLHSRCQYIGELMQAAREPRTNEELLAIANSQYLMGWDTQTQIVNRRGWLQSAGVLALVGDGHVQLTDAGVALLSELVVHNPDEQQPQPAVEQVQGREIPSPPPTSLLVLEVDDVVSALRDSATDSGNSARFEQATRDAFEFLGFDAEWLGGAGRTDVRADAVLGKADTYRVIVDCKTSASGSVGDAQVDWVTLRDHKAKHDADFVALVAPAPGGARLFERATDQNVSVIAAEQLVGLCRQHAKTPLGLDIYRSLFVKGGALDTQTVDEQAEESARLAVLAGAMCGAIAEQSLVFGRLTARDLLLILASQPAAEGATEEELQLLLDTLASPLLRVLDGTVETGYRVATSRAVVQMQLETLAVRLRATS